MRYSTRMLSFFCLSFVFALPSEAEQGASIQYQSPLPNAQYVNPRSTIIIRLFDQVVARTVSAELFRVVGTTTGVINGTVSLSIDRRTILFKPEKSFAPGETVTVDFRSGLKLGNGSPVNSTSFTFHVSSTPAEVQVDQWRDFSDLPDHVAPIPATQLHPVLADTLPVDFPAISASTFGITAPGKLFLANMRFTGSYAPYLMILENSGQPVFYRALQDRVWDFKIQPNGMMTYYDSFSQAYLVMDTAYQVVDTIRCGNGYSTDVHELRVLPNGNALLMSYDPQVVDMSRIVPGGDTAAVVTGLVVQELDSRKNVIFQWRSWDHFQITDAMNVNLTAHTIDYVHGNAIEVDWDGNLLISCRHMDEVTKVDRTTGSIIWRWGGRNNQFTFVNDSLRFKWQHAVRRIANGNYTMFDNGVWRPTQFSRAIEYQLDETAMTATLVWEYRQSPDVFGGALGYVQRMPNGNTVIGWGSTTPSVTEVAPDGSKVFELSFDTGMYSYRAYRLQADFAVAVPRVDLPREAFLSQNYPNPFNNSTTIRYDLPRPGNVTMKLFDLLGREVLTMLDGQFIEAGEHQFALNASGLSSGSYFYRLTTRDGTAIRKMILLK